MTHDGSQHIIRAGDNVVLYFGFDKCVTVEGVSEKGAYNSNFGHFPFAKFIGQPWGCEVRDAKKGNWVRVLQPTPELWTLAMERRTQILFQPDISLITVLLDACPGKVIVESGTGSGSLSTSLTRALEPSGKLFTFEFDPVRYSKAKIDFEARGLKIVRAFNRNVYDEGFTLPPEEGIVEKAYADGVFLDLPQPWLALPHCDAVMKVFGRLVTFSPCIEQVQKTVDWLKAAGYQGIKTWECILKGYGCRISQKSSASESGSKLVELTETTTAIVSADGARAGEAAEQKLIGDADQLLPTHFDSLDPCAQSWRTSKDAKTSPDGGDGDSWRSVCCCEHTHFQLPCKSHTGYITVAIKAF